ncbi:hypothetical protein Q8A73_000511 [Channa argus]|nr:hypothetical protein Q8A73_000511 [Channa argus]
MMGCGENVLKVTDEQNLGSRSPAAAVTAAIAPTDLKEAASSSLKAKKFFPLLLEWERGREFSQIKWGHPEFTISRWDCPPPGKCLWMCVVVRTMWSEKEFSKEVVLKNALGSYTSARGLPVRMAGADRMTCVIYQTRGARPQEKNRPPHDKAPREPSSTHNKGSVSWVLDGGHFGRRRWELKCEGGRLFSRFQNLPAVRSVYKVDGLCELRGGLTAWRRLRGDRWCATLPQYVSSTQWSKESVRSYETTATTIPREKKSKNEEDGGEQRETEIA